MPYPTMKEILEILPELEKAALKEPTIKALPPDAPAVDYWKYEIVKKLNEFKFKNNYTQESLSKLFKIDPANLSRILSGHIQKVSIEKMFRYLHIAIMASKNKKMLEIFEKKSNEFFEMKDIRF